jgi:VWFA-related protein
MPIKSNFKYIDALDFRIAGSFAFILPKLVALLLPNSAKMATSDLPRGFRMRPCTVFSASIVSLLLACVAANCSSQISSAPGLPSSRAATTTPSPAPVFKSTAALVLVDVVVTNPIGPVHGIARNQFHLLEDGKEQKLIALEEHIAPGPAKLPKPQQLPLHIYGNTGESTDPGTVNVLLLDALNTPMADQSYVRQEMLSYLKNIPSGTRIAIFTLATRLRIVQGFSSDPAPLVAALSGKKGLPSQSTLLVDPNDTSMTDITDTMSQMGATGDAMASIQQFQADLASEQMDLRVRTTLDALQQLARYLRGVPGRKNLIWFSGSFPISMDPDATLQSPFEAMRTYSEDVRETSRMLSASRVAVYPIDARGLMVDPQFSAQTSGSGMSGQSGGSGSGGGRRGSRGSSGSGGGFPSSGQPKFAQNTLKFMQQTTAEHATMQQIAEETGGVPYYDTNPLKSAVALAIQNGSDYYTLAYVPNDKADDGRLHKIQVNLPDAPTYKLAYRHEYVTESAKKQLVNGQVGSIVAAMMRGAPASSEIAFKVRVVPTSDPELKGLPSKSGVAGTVAPTVKGPLQRYWFDYAADLHGTALNETADGMHQGSIEIVAVAYDRDGNRLNTVDQGYQVDLSPAKFDQVMQKGLQIHEEIDLPPGEIYLRTAIHDITTDRVGSVEIPLMVKPAAQM